MAEVAGTQKRSSEWACGAALERAASYVQSVRFAPSPSARIRAAASREGASAVRRLVRELPELAVPFSDSSEGREILAWFRPDRRLPLARAPIAVLELPGTPAEYLRGRPKQALRTNLTRARAEGVHCVAVESAEELTRLVTPVALHRGQAVDFFIGPGRLPGPNRIWSVAFDSADHPIAITQVVVDGPTAGLVSMVSASGHPGALVARYALQTHLLERLIHRGVDTFVVGGSMLLTSPGTRYFQYRTGFTPVRVRPVPSVRRQSSLALAA